MEQVSTFNLKWDAHQATLKSVFDTLLDAESLSDCTVGAEGQHLKAHKIMLSASSQYFKLLFSHHCGKHTVIILPGVQFHILKALMIFMYRGEILIPQDELNALLKLADFLQVKGLSDAASVLPEKKLTEERRNKSPTCSEHTLSHCGVSPQISQHRDSPELLEVSDDSSHSECLQEQDFTKVAPISTPACKLKKSDWHSSMEKPPLEQGLVPLLQAVSRHFPFHSLELPDERTLSYGMFPGAVSRPSLTSQFPVIREENFRVPMHSGELISTKPLNSVMKRSVCPVVSEEKPILQTLTETKQENSSSFNEDHVPDLILDGGDTQHQKICDENSVVISEVTDSSFCDEGFFTQQTQFQEAVSTLRDLPEQTSASYNRFKCHSCDRSYHQRHHLARHVKYECGKELQFQCPICLARFKLKDRFSVHMKYCHGKVLSRVR